MPDSFEGFEVAIKETYDKLVKEGVIEPQPDVPAPNVPLDLEAAKKQGKVCGYLHPPSLVVPRCPFHVTLSFSPQSKNVYGWGVGVE